MEKIIEELERDLEEIIEGGTTKTKREELRDLVDIRFLRMVVYSLQWSSVGYQSALRFAGMKLGKSLGSRSKKSELSLALEEIKRVIEVLRGGRVEIEIVPNMEGAQLKIYESALAADVPAIGQKICYFEEGFMEGYLDGVISKIGSLTVAGGERGITKISVEEKICFGLGDNYCGFFIKF